jgi:hypothetical protein
MGPFVCCFAVEAFSKQGANGLPGGMLLDPWNEEAERQARQASIIADVQFTIPTATYPTTRLAVLLRCTPAEHSICTATAWPQHGSATMLMPTAALSVGPDGRCFGVTLLLI